MASSLRELVVSVTANTAPYQREMERASRMGAQYFRTVQQGGASASRSWDSQTAAARTHANAIEASSQAITRYAAVAASAFGAGELMAMADAWTGVSNRLRLVTGSTEEFGRAQDDVLRIAKATYQDLTSTAAVYQNLAMVQDRLGVSGEQMARITETIGKNIAMSGGSAAASSGALIQLGQAFASGTLRAEEFNSIIEGAPKLAMALEDGLGVARGGLRALVNDGKVSAQDMARALLEVSQATDDAFGKMQVTISQATTNLRTSFLEFVGRSDDVSGASSTVASALNVVAQNIDALATVAGGAAIGALAGKMAQVGAAAARSAVGFVQSRAAAIAEAAAVRDATLAAQLKAQADVRRAQAAMTATRGTAESARASRNLAAALLAERQATNAATAAKVAYERASNLAARAGAGLLGIMGGPAGLAVTVGMVAAGWLLFRDTANEATQSIMDMQTPLDEVIKRYEKMTALQREFILNEIGDKADIAKGEARGPLFAIANNVRNFAGEGAYSEVQAQMLELAKAMDAGKISAADLDAELQKIVSKSFPEGAAGSEKFRERVKWLALEAINAYDVSKGLIDRTNTLVGTSNAAAAATDGTTNALGRQADAANNASKAIDQHLGSLQNSVNNQIVNLVRLREGAAEAFKVEVGMKINEAGGPDKLTKEQRAEYNRQIEIGLSLIRQTEEATKRNAASTRALSAARREAANASESDKYLEQMNQSYAEQVQSLERQIALYGDVGRAGAMAYDLVHGSLSALSDEQKKTLQDQAEWLDWLDEMADIQKAWDDAGGKVKETTDKMTVYAEQAGRNMQDAFADFLFDPFDKGLGGMLESFAKTLQQMSAQAVASNLFNSMGQWGNSNAGAGGFWGAIARGVGNMFSKGAGKAGGGNVSPFTAYDVTEHGPELLQYGGRQVLMMGAQGGLVSPLMQMPGGGATGGGGDLQVVINNNGDSKVSARQERSQGADGSMMRRLIIDVVGESLNGGELGGIGKARYGWRDAV